MRRVPAVLLLLLGLPIVVGHASPRAQPPPAAGRDVATIYTELCANCHGATLAGGPAPSLVDDDWAHGADDDSVTRSIREGWPATGMPPFQAALSDQEVRTLVIYLREMKVRAATPRRVGAAQAGDLRSDAEREAGLPSRNGRRQSRHAVGPGVPAGWRSPLHGAQRPAPARDRRAPEPDRRRRPAVVLGASGWRAVRRRGPPRLRVERLALLRVQRDGWLDPRLVEHTRHPRAAARQHARGSGDALQGRARALLGRQLPLRGALPLRRAEVPLLLDRRSRPHGRCPGSREPLRQAPSDPRRWAGSGRQSVRRQARRR